MSITDELREAISELRVECEEKEGCGVLWYPEPSHDRFSEIADRIDQQHEECAGFCRRLEDAAKEGAEVTIFGTDYIPLPKDADGETIRIVDELDGYNKTIEVVELRYGRSGWVLISRDGNAYHDTFAFVRHHEPTVEDVLRDVVTLCHNTWKEESPFHFYDVDDVMKSGNIADFAAKLRLAGEDAIEATLGRGECHAIVSDNLTESEGTGDAWANCSECGHLLCVLTDPSSQMPNYCPNCGRKVGDE